MTSDSDDALSWDGDETHPADAKALPHGWNAVGKGSGEVGRLEADGTVTAPGVEEPLGTAMLVIVGVIGGIYLLYSIGWVIGGLNIGTAPFFLVPDVMHQVALWAAALAPALWFSCVWALTRRSKSWVRLAGLLLGVILLVPWPFIMWGAGV